MDCIQNAALAAVDFARYIPVTSSITGLSLIIYGLAKATFNYFAEWHGTGEGNKLTFQDFKTVRYERALGLEYAKMGCIEFIPFGRIVHSFLYPPETEPKISTEVKTEAISKEYTSPRERRQPKTSTKVKTEASISEEYAFPRERRQTQNSSYFVQIKTNYNDLEAEMLRLKGVKKEIISEGKLNSFFTNDVPPSDVFYSTRFDSCSTENMQRLTQILEKNPGELLHTSIHNINWRTGDKTGDLCMYYNFIEQDPWNGQLCMIISTCTDKCCILPINNHELVTREEQIYFLDKYNTQLEYEENLPDEFETI